LADEIEYKQLLAGGAFNCRTAWELFSNNSLMAEKRLRIVRFDLTLGIDIYDYDYLQLCIYTV